MLSSVAKSAGGDEPRRLQENHDVSRKSLDSQMASMLNSEKDQITAYAGSMIAIAERLWLNNRMPEFQYKKLKSLYASLPLLHDEIRSVMGTALES
jgi:hypothetical protein